jgi:uncharacterized protein YcfL
MPVMMKSNKHQDIHLTVTVYSYDANGVELFTSKFCSIVIIVKLMRFMTGSEG